MLAGSSLQQMREVLLALFQQRCDAVPPPSSRLFPNAVHHSWLSYLTKLSGGSRSTQVDVECHLPPGQGRATSGLHRTGVGVGQPRLCPCCRPRESEKFIGRVIRPRATHQIGDGPSRGNRRLREKSLVTNTKFNLPEAFYEHDVCRAVVNFGIQNRAPVARNIHVTREHRSRFQFCERFEVMCREVEEPKAATT